MPTILFYTISFLLILSALKNNESIYKNITYILNIVGIIFTLYGLSNFYYFSPDRHNMLFGDRVFESEIAISLLGFLLSRQINKKSNEMFFSILFILSNTSILIYCLELRTRSAWLALAVIIISMFYFIIKVKKDNSSKNRFSGELIITVLIAVFFSFSFSNKSNLDRSHFSETLYSIFKGDYPTNKIRLHFWSASLKMFAEKPISGIGIGKWAGLYPIYNGDSYADDNVDMNSAINPHNDYIEILTEYGIFGFIIFTGFIFTGLYFLFNKSKQDIVYLPFFLSALGLSITMFFSFTKDNFWAMMVFSLCIAVGYSNNSQYRFQNSEFYIKYKKHIKTFAFAVGIIMLVTGIWFKVMIYLNEKEYLGAMNLKAQNKYTEMLVKLDGVSDYFYPVDMNKMPVDYYRGVGYFKLKQYDMALVRFRDARKYMKYYPTIMNNEASALYMNGKISEAESLFVDIKNLFPNYIEPQINLLSLYTNINKFSQAKRILTEIEKKTFDEKYVKNYSVFLGIKNYLTENQNK